MLLCTIGHVWFHINVINILEQPANMEKGFSQRFLWFVLEPILVPFEELEKVNRDFSVSTGIEGR